MHRDNYCMLKLAAFRDHTSYGPTLKYTAYMPHFCREGGGGSTSETLVLIYQTTLSL